MHIFVVVILVLIILILSDYSNVLEKLKMSVRLKYIDVENFKSYSGFKRIGPMFPFMAVIGPNGSGNFSITIVAVPVQN